MAQVSTQVLLLNKVLHGGTPAYRALIRAGFRPEWLQDPELRRVWNTVTVHISQFRDVPTERYVRQRVPSFIYLPFDEVEREQLLALSEDSRDDFMQARTEHIAYEAIRLNERDPKEAVRYLLENAQRLLSTSNPVEAVQLSSSIDEIRDDYDQSEAGLSLGLEWPWQSVQDETLGIHPCEFSIIYGRPKSKKTFVGLRAVVSAYLNSHARVLVVSREMPVPMMRRRIVAFIAGIYYGPWRRGKLSPWEKRRVFDILESLLDMESLYSSPGHPDLFPGIMIASGHSKHYKGLDLVEALIEDFQPDLVFDDGFYLAAQGLGNKYGPMDWRVISTLTQGAKGVAMRNKVAYLATTQANRESKKQGLKAGLESTAFADSFSQDCDFATHVINMGNYAFLTFPGFREGQLDVVPIHAIPCANFDEMTIEEMEDAGINREVIDEAKRRDMENLDVPAGPTDNVDEMEREIPISLQQAGDIPKAKTPKRRRKKK